MSPKTKSNIAPATRHVMTPEQKARRTELFAGDIRLPGIVEIGRYHYAAAYEPLRLRTHPDGLEICFLARGRQTYRVNGRIYRLRGGEQYLVFPGEPHDSAGMPEEKGELYWLFVRLKPARQRLLFLTAAASADLRRELLAMPARHFAAAPGTRELLEEIFALVPTARSRADRLHVASRVLQFLLATIRASQRNRRAAPSPRIQRCLDHIARHPADPLTVPHLARLVRLSPSRFKMRFRAEIGLPPREYVLRHKLSLADIRLRRGEAVTAVAHDLGFSSSQYFATVFRRFAGHPPSALQPPRRPGRTSPP
ncbi:AraC family transcriptional regulator [Horticoccus luteus]|uniref:AraC family transcriptional regulator n=1 Tax=Horticoccus luteus TaxID=2862869 RepID=A0A8F9TRJ2_9BACT|nr:AraC family transcriptional regulator [Horticoccus luteus]QYM77879.1 AraC family transcriptional regulator [Horticoccus luteus]